MPKFRNWEENNDEDYVQPLNKKQRADDDLRNIPTVESTIDDIDGRLVLFIDDRSDRVIIKLDKERPEIEVAVDEIEIPENSIVLDISAGDGGLPLTLASVNNSSYFYVTDPRLQESSVCKRNLAGNFEVTNISWVNYNDFEAGHMKELGINTVVYSPDRFTAKDLVKSNLIQASHLLTEGGAIYLVTHKNSGAEGLRNDAQDLFGQNQVEIVGRGRGGVRVIKCVKSGQNIEDIDLKQSINFEVVDHRFDVQTEPSIFSGDHLDSGTRLLIESVARSHMVNYRNMLDIGCGWGPLGLVAASLNPRGHVTFVDIDRRAVSLALHNAELLGVRDRVQGIVTDNITRDISRGYDLALSNPPFHANTQVLEGIFSGVRDCLDKRSDFYIVVERTYVDRLGDILFRAFGNTQFVTQNEEGFYVLVAQK